MKVDVAALQNFGRSAIEKCSTIFKRESALSALSEIHVLLVSDRRIAELHQYFHEVTGPTDVITFQHGEIVISAQTAQRQAGEFRTSTQGELELYLLHGLLHLHGFDDETAADARRMNGMQSKMLRLLQQRLLK